MTIYYIHRDTDEGNGLDVFLTEAEQRAAQIELMEKARDNEGEAPDYDDEDGFFEAWSDFCDNGTINQDYYFADSVSVEGVVLANQPELKL